MVVCRLLVLHRGTYPGRTNCCARKKEIRLWTTYVIPYCVNPWILIDVMAQRTTPRVQSMYRDIPVASDTPAVVTHPEACSILPWLDIHSKPLRAQRCKRGLCAIKCAAAARVLLKNTSVHPS